MPNLLDFLIWRKLKGAGGSGPVYEIPQGWLLVEDKKPIDTGYNPFADGPHDFTLMAHFATFITQPTNYNLQVIGGPGLKVYCSSTNARFNNNYHQTAQQWTATDALDLDVWKCHVAVITVRAKVDEHRLTVTAGFPGKPYQSHDFACTVFRPGNITLYGTYASMGIRRCLIYDRYLSDADIQAFYDSQVEFTHET